MNDFFDDDDEFVVAANATESTPASITQQLIDATRAGNLMAMRQILSQIKNTKGVDVGRDDDMEAALLAAACRGCIESCQLLLEKLSPDLRRKYSNEGGETTGRIIFYAPLHEAARGGHLEVVRLLLKEKYNHYVNQMNHRMETPLFCAMQSQRRLEVSRFLLANGADPNRGGSVTPWRIRHLHIGQNVPFPMESGVLYRAVLQDHTETVRLLLEHEADPNRNRIPASYENPNPFDRVTDLAIKNGNPEMLSILLQHRAFVGQRKMDDGTSLNGLFQNPEKPRDAKLAICRTLIEHAERGDRDTAAFLEASLEREIKDGNVEVCEILFQAGMTPSRPALYSAIQHGKISICRLLVRQHGVDPFQLQQQEEDTKNNNGDEAIEQAPPSPFHAAIRRKKTGILRFFLRRWDKRFSAKGGKNDNGQCPIHVLCRDKHVSLPAIELVLHRDSDAAALSRKDEQGQFPFYSAATSDTRLDVIYRLLLYYPDALNHLVHNCAASTPVHQGNSSGLAPSKKSDEKVENQKRLKECTGPMKKQMRKKKAKAIKRL